MKYILFYKTIDNYIEERELYREEHLNLIQKAYKNNELIMAGALAEPTGGAVLIFNSHEVANEFAENDPYVKNGIIVEWRVQPWNVISKKNIEVIKKRVN